MGKFIKFGVKFQPSWRNEKVNIGVNLLVLILFFKLSTPMSTYQLSGNPLNSTRVLYEMDIILAKQVLKGTTDDSIMLIW